MIRRLALFALLLASRAAGAQTLPIIRVDDAGRGIGPATLTRALTSPHTIVSPATARYVVARGSNNPLTILSLGRDVVVEGKVQGDVIVVGADLYMHPGGVITGRAISIGGGVYESMLATVGFGVLAFRDFTYDIAPIPGGYSLTYRSLGETESTGLMWGGLFGLSIPTYERTDGLSLGIGPSFVGPGAAFSVSPRITYRSQLGRFDPSVVADARLGRSTSLVLRGGRTTNTNDRWIRSDLVNSLTFFYNGDDTRNYYRATGGDLALTHAFEWTNGELSPYLGVRYERASSTRPGIDATGGPWTVLARSDDERDDRLRFNPPIDDGSVTSGFLGVDWRRDEKDFATRTHAEGEVSSTFAQLTVDAFVSFPTFGAQSLHANGHLVASGGGRVPRQRFVYIGGPGTLPTLELLSEGGDELLYVDAGYDIPFERIKLPLVGSPVLTLREALGGARIGGFPTLHQSTGVRVTVAALYAEWMVDPARRAGFMSFGLTL